MRIRPTMFAQARRNHAAAFFVLSRLEQAPSENNCLAVAAPALSDIVLQTRPVPRGRWESYSFGSFFKRIETTVREVWR